MRLGMDEWDEVDQRGRLRKCMNFLIEIKKGEKENRGLTDFV